MRRVIHLREFCPRINERAPITDRRGEFFRQSLKHSYDLFAWRIRVGLDSQLELRPKMVVRFLQVSHQQIIFRRKMTVKGHLCHPGAFNNGVYTDGLITLAEKQLSHCL